MTLHEAIEQVLKVKGQPLTPTEIADILNKIQIYTKGDKSKIKSNQISARVNNYPAYFFKVNGLIHLKNWETKFETPLKAFSNIEIVPKLITEKHIIKRFENVATTEFLLKNNFDKLGLLSYLLRNGLPNNKNLNLCGIYAISVPNGYLPEYFTPEESSKRGNVINPWTIERMENKWVEGSRIIYYGLAGDRSIRSLKERLQDLLNHGNGKISSSGPHKGGEILWQLKKYETFEIWIYPTNGPPDPRIHEELILRIFLEELNQLPFANRKI